MLLKKNRQSLRGLSHEEKVKKLQKLTKVPLQNLKTNIAQSDFQQDDVSVPICLKLPSNAKQTSCKKMQGQFDSKKKVFDQEQINKTIRAMTKELYSLQMQKQKQQKNIFQNHQASISIFSIDDFSFDMSSNKNMNQPTKAALEDFYSTSKNGDSTDRVQSRQLLQISAKSNNRLNIPFLNCQKIPKKKDHYYRQTEPMLFQHNIESTRNLFSPKLDLNKHKENQQSQINKRFSRSKRNSQQLIQQQFEKKPKFNRSNQKNRVLLMNPASNKQNIENIYTTKKGLLTERLSYQHIPTSETFETALKKRKNICKNFMTFQNQNNLKESIEGEDKSISFKGNPIKNKNSLNCALKQFEKISKNDYFKLLQQGNIQPLFQSQKGVQFISQMFNNYKNSIQLIKANL